MTRTRTIFGIAAAAAILQSGLAMGPAVASADVACGDTITADTALTADLTCSGTGLTIGASDITLDCQGNRIDGDGSGNGVEMGAKERVTIKNCVINGFGTQVYVAYGGQHQIKDIDVSGDGTGNGVFITASHYNMITNVNASRRSIGIRGERGAQNNRVSGNDVSHAAYAGVYFHSTSNNVFDGNNASYSENGILVVGADNSIVNNNVSHSKQGLYLTVSDTTLTPAANNDFTGCDTPIFLYNSHRNVIKDFDVSGDGSGSGIFLSASNHNTVVNVNASRRSIGIRGERGSAYNKIMNNNVSHCTYAGVYFHTCSNNTVDGNDASYCDNGILSSGQDNAIVNNDLSYSKRGLYLVTSNMTLSPADNNVFTGAETAIHFWDSSYNVVKDLDLSGDAARSAVSLSDSSYNTVININASGRGLGIEVRNSHHNRFLNNNVSHAGCGVWMHTSSNNEVDGNNASHCTWAGILGQGQDNVIVNNDLRNAKLGLYLVTSGMTVSPADNNDFTGAETAIHFWGSSDNVVRDLDLSGDGTGSAVSLDSSERITVANLNASRRGTGIRASNSHYNRILNNNVTDSGVGLWFHTSANNVFDGNDASHSGWGILSQGQDNTIVNNEIASCDLGLYLVGAAPAAIYHNNIYDSSDSGVYSDGPIELSYNGKGNWWGRTEPPYFVAGEDSNAADVVDSFPYGEKDAWKCTDADGDGFGATGTETAGCPGQGFDCDDADPAIIPGTVIVTDVFGSGDTGECRTRLERCDGGAGELALTQNPIGPADEICDGLDNDCDASTDEELGTATCGLGVCLHTIDNCAEGAPQTCDPLQGASSERCDDTLDNDCDGEVNEICPGPPQDPGRPEDPGPREDPGPPGGEPPKGPPGGAPPKGPPGGGPPGQRL
ncbi:MAG: NosD domain-containing protein [Elusimicrobiota bacterium]